MKRPIMKVNLGLELLPIHGFLVHLLLALVNYITIKFFSHHLTSRISLTP